MHPHVLVWGYLVVFVKINNIPAHSSVTHPPPDSLWHNAAIGPERRGSTVTNCSPQSGCCVCPQLAHHLAWQIFYFPVVVCLLF